MSDDTATRTGSDTSGGVAAAPEHRGDRSRHRGGLRRQGRRGGGGARLVRVAADALDVRRAFGRPEQQGDVTVVPVALVVGGAGAGWGSGEAAAVPSTGTGDSAGSGGGGGFGLRVRPLGVYVVEGSTVTWRPALDVTRVALGGQLLAAVAVLALAGALRRRRG